MGSPQATGTICALGGSAGAKLLCICARRAHASVCIPRNMYVCASVQ